MKSAQQNIRIPLFPIGAEITVYRAEGFSFETGSGELATLTGLDGNELPNPYAVTVAGQYFHTAKNGLYHIKISAAGWNEGVPVWLYAVLHCDPNTLLNRTGGIATNLKETSRVITNPSTTTVSWLGGHVVINDISLASLTITDVPTDAAAFLTITVFHTSAARSIGWVTTNILSKPATYASAGTYSAGNPGFDKYCAEPSGLGDGKFFLRRIESK